MLGFLLRAFRQPSSQPLLLDATPRILMTAAQLAQGLHFVENNGSMRLFGTDSCPHQERAEKVFDYLIEHPTLPLQEDK